MSRSRLAPSNVARKTLSRKSVAAKAPYKTNTPAAASSPKAASGVYRPAPRPNKGKRAPKKTAV
ncbi:hypothetical protein BCR34DRAFT_596257 [Clohesyomyces aquaticus]|uniref:Uncharacterized protein n=1 Tax=Clohesyomyces aquaticus TaxID=1231657 RepID=A0A1Y2A6Y8_9PLEO|nr:hypothetical protein BCR34DRAFT_596257 [Clohesyomyces aquaticus]